VNIYSGSWVMGQLFNGSNGSWVTLHDPLSPLLYVYCVLLDVEPIRDVCRRNRLRWLGHVERCDERLEVE
jgi:hypothetical protein